MQLWCAGRTARHNNRRCFTCHQRWLESRNTYTHIHIHIYSTIYFGGYHVVKFLPTLYYRIKDSCNLALATSIASANTVCHHNNCHQQENNPSHQRPQPPSSGVILGSKKRWPRNKIKLTREKKTWFYIKRWGAAFLFDYSQVYLRSLPNQLVYQQYHLCECMWGL